MTTTRARGVLFVHSSPRALCPHLEWAIGSALGYPVNCRWEDQPVLPGTLRAEMEWMGPVGSGAAIASSLRGWEHLRYEVMDAHARPGGLLRSDRLQREHCGSRRSHPLRPRGCAGECRRDVTGTQGCPRWCVG